MPYRKLFAAVALSAALATLAACGSARRSAETAEARPRKKGVSVAGRFVAAPVMRIGLEEATGGVVTVKAPGGLVLTSLPRGKAIAQRRMLPQISFFVADPSAGRRTETFRVQIASLRDKGAADKLAAEVRRKLGLTVAVGYNSQTRTHRVQVGQAPSREAAASIEKRLRAAGYKETWVVREAATAVSGGAIAAVDPSGRRIASAAVFRCAPKRSREKLEVGGVRYRGALELRVSKDGRVLPVNIVNIDEYLRGVVPVEMSPTAFPQLDALKAQAVAARTYAYRNRGQYSSDGYDICESARCQVYSGADAERELTDRAVKETAGEVAFYNGEPINALFTSTCGGHTEDAANVFPGEDVPYLVGVPCEPEAELFSNIDSGTDPTVTYGADGLPLDYELAALEVAGVLRRGFTPQVKNAVSGEQWATWLQRLARRLGAGNAGSVPAIAPQPSLEQAIVAAAATAGWQRRIKNQVSEGDLQLLAGFEGLGEIDAESGRALLYFLRLGLVRPEPDGSLPFKHPLSQTAALRMLYRLLLQEGTHGVVEGKLVRADGESITLQEGVGVKEYKLEVGTKLFKSFQGYTVPVRSLQMAPGDRITLVLRDRSEEAGVLVHSPSLEGIASDRSSRYFHWDVSYTPQELQEKISRYADVGRIEELRPLRHGVSERVVELEVIGSGGNAVLKGLQIRWALGLRENLFVIEKRYDELGRIEAWRFIGKGWGHGVGLCQVGASGMAISGADYREILRHYYSGIEIKKVY